MSGVRWSMQESYLVPHHAAVAEVHGCRIKGCLSNRKSECGERVKRRRVDIRVHIDLAALPRPPGFFYGSWVHVGGGLITEFDVSAWPCSVGLPCKLSSLLGALIGLPTQVIKGIMGFLSLELLILIEQWVGHRLLSGKVVRPQSPQFLFSAPVTEGIEIGQGCRFISSLVRALGKLLGGIGRFLLSARVRVVGVSGKRSCGASRGVFEALLRHHTVEQAFPVWVGWGPVAVSSREVEMLRLVRGRMRVLVTSNTRPGIPVHSRPEPGLPKPKRWKRLTPSPPPPPPKPQVLCARPACLSTFFLTLGLVDFAAWTLGTCSRRLFRHRGSRLVSPAEGTSQCTGKGPFQI